MVTKMKFKAIYVRDGEKSYLMNESAIKKDICEMIGAKVGVKEIFIPPRGMNELHRADQNYKQNYHPSIHRSLNALAESMKGKIQGEPVFYDKWWHQLGCCGTAKVSFH